MDVVALVSGGKDSCYSILQCQKHGHKKQCSHLHLRLDTHDCDAARSETIAHDLARQHPSNALFFIHNSTVVALANLLPPDSSVDELDSYMFQTVGHQLVSAYATCTGLPLYRRRIQGHSHSQGLSYSTTAGDEVEDLFLLLAYIKEAHPNIKAVASGAIASDYQRLRVESVCSRLGLVSLGYLWHQPQEQLLADMIANDIEAVLVKVAALGLDPHKHLGKTIHQLQPHLHRLRDRFGCNVCGEGGEYETLTLDCPAFTYGRIVLDSWEVVLHSPDSIAAVGVLHPTAFHIEPKDSSTDTVPSSQAVTEVPLDWQPQQAHPPAQPVTQSDPSSSSACVQQWQTELKLTVSQQHVHIMCSAQAPSAAAGGTGGVGGGGTAAAAAAAASFSAEDTAAALEAALLAVSSQLEALQGITSWQSSCFVHLYLADMAHFGVANAAYCRHLPQVNPPSRACVQVPLPAGCPVLLDVLFARQPGSSAAQPGAAAVQQQQESDRHVLHVQSISDWAPSCIGPYSQATTCNGIIHMAGQIPLDPGSMNIITTAAAHHPNSSSSSNRGDHLAWAVAAQAWRTLCSCQAVAVAVKSCFASSCLGLTVYLTPEAAAAGGQGIVQAAVQAVQRDRSLLSWPDKMPPALAAAAAVATGDAADAAAATAAEGGAGEAHRHCVHSRCGSDTEGDDEQQEVYVDEYLRPPVVQEVLEPAVVYLIVPALPRGALLEVQPLLVDLSATAAAAAASSSSSDEDGGAATGPAAALSAGTPSCDDLLHVDVLQKHSMQVDVTWPADGSWRRVLLQLQRGSGSGTDSSEDLKAQAAAAGSWITMYCSQQPTAVVATIRATEEAGQQDSAGQMVSLRCWYDQTLQWEAGDSHRWLHALLSKLPTKLAGQMVPVLSAESSAAGIGHCWCLIEIINRL